MIIFHETQIHHSKIRVAHKATEKIISKIKRTEWDFELGGMKYTEQLENLIDKPDEYLSVHMTRLQQYVHQLIRVIGRKINEIDLDDVNSSYYKKVSLEMK